MSTVTPTGASLLSSLRPEARHAPESGIVEVVNHGRLKEGLIPLWVGEGDLPTPDFIARAANASLAKGETFYTWQRGIPDLREALARWGGAGPLTRARWRLQRLWRRRQTARAHAMPAAGRS